MTQTRRPEAPGLVADERGIAAMEFAIIAPMIVGLYLGLAEFSLAMSIDRQVSHSASVAGDMVAQVTSVADDDMADILAATLRVSQVQYANDYTIEIISYELDDDGNVQDLGRATYNPAQSGNLATVNPEDFGPELLSEDSGVIVANVAYKYSPLGYKDTVKGGDDAKETILGASLILRETFMLKPRRSTTIEIGGGSGSTLTCSGVGASLSCS